MVKYGIEIFARVKPGKGRIGVRNLICISWDNCQLVAKNIFVKFVFINFS